MAESVKTAEQWSNACRRVWVRQQLSSVTLASSPSGEELCCWLDRSVQSESEGQGVCQFTGREMAGIVLGDLCVHQLHVAGLIPMSHALKDHMSPVAVYLQSTAHVISILYCATSRGRLIPRSFTCNHDHITWTSVLS